MGVGTGHSAAFSYDGKTVVFGHEPGGGVAAQCQTTSSVAEPLAVLPERRDRRPRSRTLQHPRFQDATENCTWHNFNTVPTKGGNFLVSGNYQAGITVIDYTQPAAPKVIAFADPEAAAAHDHLRRRRLPGRRRLVDLLVQRQDLRVRHLPRPDDVGPRQLVHQAGEHGRVLQPADADRRDRGRQRRPRRSRRPTRAPATCAAPRRRRRTRARTRASASTRARARRPRWTRPRSATTRTRSRPWTRPATRRPRPSTTWSTASPPTPRGRLGRGHAVADAGRAGAVRRVHAGRREGVHGHHDGQRHLHRGRRDAVGQPTRARPTRASSSTARSPSRSRCRVWAWSRRTPARSPTTSRRSRSSRRSAPMTRCAPGRTARR